MTTTRDRRKADRDRKALERKARREAGLPDPALLDKILVDALRECVVIGLGHGGLPTDPRVKLKFELRDVLKRALRDLGRREYDKRACASVIAARLAPVDGSHPLPPAPQAEAPSQVAGLKTQAPTETAPSGLDADVQAALDAMLWGEDGSDA